MGKADELEAAAIAAATAAAESEDVNAARELLKRAAEMFPAPAATAPETLAELTGRLGAALSDEGLAPGDRKKQAKGLVGKIERLLPLPTCEDTEAEELALIFDDTKGVKIPTGIPEFDKAFDGGFGVGVHVLGAMMGDGKTNLAAQFGESAAIAGYPVLFVSFEMAPYELRLRSLARWAGVPHNKINGKKGAKDKTVVAAIEKTRGWRNRVTIIDATQGKVKPRDIIERAQGLRARSGGKSVMVIVDFLQAMGRKLADGSDKMREVLGDILGDFSGAARADDAVFVLVSQVNRDSYDLITREDDFSMSVFKESSDIETYADNAFVVARKVVGGQDMVLKVMKSRGGVSVGKVADLRFEGAFCRFKGSSVNADWTKTAGRFSPGGELREPVRTKPPKGNKR